MKTFHPFLIGLGIIVVFSLALLLFPGDEISGAAQHADYPSFSEADDAVITDGTLRVIDTLVLDQGWYSIDGAPWQPFTLSGTGFSDGWLAGAGTYDLPSGFETIGEHYLIVYSCSSEGRYWECNGNRWQLLVITVEDTVSINDFIPVTTLDDELNDDGPDGSLDSIDLDSW